MEFQLVYPFLKLVYMSPTPTYSRIEGKDCKDHNMIHMVVSCVYVQPVQLYKSLAQNS